MTLRFLLLSSLLAASPAGAVTFSDNFNSGTDAGWTRYQPLSPFGAGGTYTFPGGNTYRIAAAASPNPGVLGPARAGSFRTTNTYTDFDMSVDIVDYDSSQSNMVIGLIGRAASPGLQTTDGYALIVGAGQLSIQVIDNEAPTAVVVGVPLTYNPATQYRAFFHAVGTTLSAEIYDINNLATPLASISGTDTTYSSGINGVFVFANTTNAGATARATFDNYFTADAIPEPAAAGLAGLGLLLTLRRRR